MSTGEDFDGAGMLANSTTRHQKLRAVTAVMRRVPEGRYRDEILAALFAEGRRVAPRGMKGRPAAKPEPPSAPKPPRKRAQCGTPQAYRRHLANAEEPCQPCRDAIAAVRREARATQKERGQR